MARILLIGTDRSRARGIRSILRHDGHDVVWTRAVEGWREIEREAGTELVVAAVSRTDDVLRAEARRVRGFPPPLLFVQRDADLFRAMHLDERLVDSIESPFLSEEFGARVDGLIRARRIVTRNRGDQPGRTAGASKLLRRIGGRVASILGARLPKIEKPAAQYAQVAARLAEWADKRDAFEPGHSERVTSFSALIAEALGLGPDQSSAVLRAALLHDIGKVALPVEMLRQRRPLRDEQRRLIRTHPQRGAALVRALDNDPAVAEAILYHHEQPDGSGYYQRPSLGIPQAASILGVAEAYDAMTSTRLRGRLSRDAALDKLRAERGRKYDRDCVNALADALEPRKLGVDTIPLAEGHRRRGLRRDR